MNNRKEERHKLRREKINEAKEYMHLLAENADNLNQGESASILSDMKKLKMKSDVIQRYAEEIQKAEMAAKQSINNMISSERMYRVQIQELCKAVTSYKHKNAYPENREFLAKLNVFMEPYYNINDAKHRIDAVPRDNYSEVLKQIQSFLNDGSYIKAHEDVARNYFQDFVNQHHDEVAKIHDELARSIGYDEKINDKRSREKNVDLVVDILVMAANRNAEYVKFTPKPTTVNIENEFGKLCDHVIKEIEPIRNMTSHLSLSDEQKNFFNALPENIRSLNNKNEAVEIKIMKLESMLNDIRVLPQTAYYQQKYSGLVEEKLRGINKAIASSALYNSLSDDKKECITTFQLDDLKNKIGGSKSLVMNEVFQHTMKK